jgi:lipocalin
MSRLSALALVLVVLMSSSGRSFAATCVNPDTVEPFDLSAYMGQWYGERGALHSLPQRLRVSRGSRLALLWGKGTFLE